MAFKKIFDRHFLGDPKQRDYGPDDQPHTRRELFQTVFAVRAGRMTGYSLIYSLAWLPAIIWSSIVLLKLFALLNGGAALDTAQMQSIGMGYALIMMPLVTVTGPFHMAASYVMRNWARDEHADLTLDYRYAWKKNWKQGLMYSFSNGVLIPVMFFYLSVLSVKAQTNALFYLPIAVLIFMLLFWQLCCMIIPTMCVTYKLSYRQIVRNAIIISCAQLFRAIGVWLITMIVPIIAVAICCLEDLAALWAFPCVTVFNAVFGFGLRRLICASYANMVCEKYINSKIEGAPTNIGLR